MWVWVDEFAIAVGGVPGVGVAPTAELRNNATARRFVW